jgi:hypothetical protein
MKKLLLPMLLILIATGFMTAQINENFEGATPTLTWEALDGKWDGIVNNPRPNFVNISKETPLVSAFFGQNLRLP